jgi:hypothetical protein
MNRIAIGLTLCLTTLTAGDALAAKKALALKDAWLDFDLTHKPGDRLRIDVRLDGQSPAGIYGYMMGFKRHRVFTVPGVVPRGATRTMRYKGESFGNETVERQGNAHGFITAVAAKDAGVVIVDTSTHHIANGITPDKRVLYSLASLRGNSVVRGIADKHGLDVGTLAVKVSDASLSAAYVDRSFLTLSFTVELADTAGKRAEAQLSTIVDGGFEGGSPYLKKGQPLEEGVKYSRGRAYPPSVELK